MFCRSSANSNLGTTYVLRDRVPVNGLVYDPMFTIVFTLEYMVYEPVSQSSGKVTVCLPFVFFLLKCLRAAGFVKSQYVVCYVSDLVPF